MLKTHAAAISAVKLALLLSHCRPLSSTPQLYHITISQSKPLPAHRQLPTMQSVTRRLTAILTHISPPPPSTAAAFTCAIRHRLQSYHTRIARRSLTALTDASFAISRLPTALPLPAANLPTSPSSSSYASVWSCILASSFSSSSASPVKPIIPPQSAADAGKPTVVLDMDECLLHHHTDSTYMRAGK